MNLGKYLQQIPLKRLISLINSLTKEESPGGIMDGGYDMSSHLTKKGGANH